MVNEYKYIQFPLFLIRELHIPKNQINTINQIFDFGIYTYSKQFKLDDTAACRQVIYSYYRGGLTLHLYGILDTLYSKGELLSDDDYNGFEGDTFNPFELDEFIEIVKNDDSIREMCLEFYGMHLAMKSLNLTGTIESVIQSAKEVGVKVEKHENKYGKEPLVMLKTDLIFDYYRKEKSFEDIILFTAYAGIKSIIGKKDFTATTKIMIVGRMIGAKSDKVLQEFLQNKSLNQIHTKYLKRHWFEKLIGDLLKRGFIQSKMPMRIGLKSRICVSCKLNYQELPVAVAEYWNVVTGNKKLKELKEQERAAIKQFKALITAP